MARVTFTKDFNWVWGNGRMATAFKAGMTETVKRECADEAIGKGAAKKATSSNRKASTSKADADGDRD